MVKNQSVQPIFLWYVELEYKDLLNELMNVFRLLRQESEFFF
jgi:hypothetical protein